MQYYGGVPRLALRQELIGACMYVLSESASYYGGYRHSNCRSYWRVVRLWRDIRECIPTLSAGRPRAVGLDSSPKRYVLPEAIDPDECEVM